MLGFEGKKIRLKREIRLGSKEKKTRLKRAIENREFRGRRPGHVM
jgi:hypothetical protein